MRTIVLALTISFALPAFAQGTVDKHGRYIPTQEEIEASKRMADSLQHPTFVTLRLVFLNPNTGETSDSAPFYKPTDRIAICIILNHYFSSPITLMESLNQHMDLQLQLLRDGVIVPYKNEAQKQLDRALTEPANGSAAPVQFLPGKDYTLRPIDLSDWYQQLLSGHYQLTVRRRFVREGQWVQSDSVIFDISPDKP